jgi:hypothetical protein
MVRFVVNSVLVASSLLVVGYTAVLASPDPARAPAAVVPTPTTSAPSTTTAPTQNAGTQPGAAQPDARDPNRRVCRKTELTGSRLRSFRVCRTAREWNEVDEQAQKAAKGLLDPARGSRPKGG